MKRILAILAAITLMATVFSGCNENQNNQTSETSATKETTTAATETEITKETESTSTEATSSTDEFPTESDSSAVDTSGNNFTEPQNRWSVNVPGVWDKYGDKIITNNGNEIKFVYKKAYNDYGAGHVFTICTTNASNKVDVTQYPHAEEIYLDSNIQVYVMYPTDVQFGGIDGSDMETQSVEYGKLKNTTDQIINSLNVIK